MTFNDRVSGLLLLALGLAVAGYARTFPPMPGQAIGPSLFPTLVGVSMALLGIVLVVGGSVRDSSQDVPWVTVDDGLRRPRMALNFVAVIVALVGYALVVDWLGFFITGALLLGALLTSFGVRLSLTLPLAVVVTIAIHYIFYGLLGVPLPWGLLEAIAW